MVISWDDFVPQLPQYGRTVYQWPVHEGKSNQYCCYFLFPNRDVIDAIGTITYLASIFVYSDNMQVSSVHVNPHMHSTHMYVQACFRIWTMDFSYPATLYKCDCSIREFYNVLLLQNLTMTSFNNLVFPQHHMLGFFYNKNSRIKKIKAVCQ